MWAYRRIHANKLRTIEMFSVTFIHFFWRETLLVIVSIIMDRWTLWPRLLHSHETNYPECIFVVLLQPLINHINWCKGLFKSSNHVSSCIAHLWCTCEFSIFNGYITKICEDILKQLIIRNSSLWVTVLHGLFGHLRFLISKYFFENFIFNISYLGLFWLTVQCSNRVRFIIVQKRADVRELVPNSNPTFPHTLIFVTIVRSSVR